MVYKLIFKLFSYLILIINKLVISIFIMFVLHIIFEIFKHGLILRFVITLLVMMELVIVRQQLSVTLAIQILAKITAHVLLVLIIQ